MIEGELVGQSLRDVGGELVAAAWRSTQYELWVASTATSSRRGDEARARAGSSRGAGGGGSPQAASRARARARRTGYQARQRDLSASAAGEVAAARQSRIARSMRSCETPANGRLAAAFR